MKRKNKKLKIKKAYSGDFMTAETSSSMYESGRAAAMKLFKIAIKEEMVAEHQLQLKLHKQRKIQVLEDF
jgi:hypothetical protein